MKGLLNWFEEHFIPVAAKIGSQRHLVAIRDGFIAIMPLIIAGSVAVMINNLSLPGYDHNALMSKIFGDGWRALGGNVWWGTLAMMALLVSFTIAYNLAKSYDVNPLTAGVLSVSSFMVLIPQMFVSASVPEALDGIAVPAELVGKTIGTWGNINWSFLSYSSLFGAIAVALIVTEIYVKLVKSKKFEIKLPENVPPAVSKTFATLVPVMITIFIVGFAQVWIDKTGTSVSKFLLDVVQKPVSEVGNTLGGAIAVAFSNHIFWFFGLHGSNILDPVMQSVFMPLATANADLLAQGKEMTYIVTKSFFDGFVYMGGSGTTVGLLAAIFVFGKDKAQRSIAKIAAPTSLFNINEPVVFGLPIVLNPLFFLPFVFGPVILTIISYTATAVGLVPMTSVIVPWTTPPVIGAFLATNGSVAAAALALFNLALTVVMYLPFVILSNRKLEKSL
ncbi:MAG: PTS sugar transporter subunit IIC [Clostridia bacterium]|nr:PTS sugar transporter subunit IIC [Clostridia bacterium]